MNPPDRLDLRKQQPRWVMYYSDGSIDYSMYRWDLIRNPSNTILTKEAAKDWPIYERPDGMRSEDDAL